MKISNPTINSRICNRGEEGSKGVNDTKAGSCNSVVVTSGGLEQSLTAALGDEGAEKWPKINNGTDDTTLRGSSSGSKKYGADASSTVAKDLVEKLTSEEKTIVAGLLAKTIEGGEVVEIRAVSSTSLRT
ncbi:hypothetical protein ANAPC1_00614 [Anaplasma phagocytophilum]|uniref:Uncharacterized protein n=1 Tax=Anaplasma phagocytophilum TaxID=948 RepID=A0AA45UT02_ANAPH|nr:hypothetical protein ANAPC1_00614 [Anaplasma phagocytophilum]